MEDLMERISESLNHSEITTTPQTVGLEPKMSHDQSQGRS